MPSKIIQQIESKLQKTENPVQKVDLLNELAMEWRIYDMAKAFELAHQAQQIADLENYTEGKAYAAINLGLFFIKTGKFDKATDYSASALDLFEECADKKGIAAATCNLGLIHLRKGDHELAFKYFAESMRTSRLIDDKQSEARALGYMGYIYDHFGDHESALTTYTQLLNYSLELGNLYDEARVYNALALLYESKEDYDKSQEFITKSLKLHKEIGDKRGLMIAYNLDGRTKLCLHHLDAAETSLRHALEMSKSINDRFTTAFNHLDLGKVYNGQKKYSQADIHLNKALSLAEAISSKEIIYQSCQQLSVLYEAKGNYHKAYEYYRRYHEVAEQVKSAEIKGKITIQQANHQRQLAEKETELERIRNTELKQALKDLKNAQGQLIQAEKMASVGQLTAGIAHEINNPINFVSANISPLKTDVEELLEILEKFIESARSSPESAQFEEAENLLETYDYEFLVAEIKQLLKGIEEGAHRTAEIVKGLRNFSRMDEDELKLADINEGIESTLLILQNKLKHHVTVEKQFQSVPKITCYPGKLNQVFMNIINNAVDAIIDSPNGKAGKGKITISTGYDNKHLTISISDNGKGIPPEAMQRIFEPFFTTKEVGKGTGLGLSISYGIIKDHNGAIEVYSKPGKGSQFIISLPANTDFITE